MENNILYTKIQEIQKAYKNLLIEIFPLLASDVNLNSILDEIIVFWDHHRNIVRCFSQYILSEKDVYVFTGGCHMDLASKEQYPFVLLGDYQVIDDVISTYANIILNNENSGITQKLKKEIVIAVQDNIKILSEYNNQILVLPIRTLKNVDEIILLSQKIFIGMFKTEYSCLEEYIKENKRIEDIENNLRIDIKNEIIFDSENNSQKSFSEKFKEAVQKRKEIFEINISESEQFFIIVQGYLSQAIDIILSCDEFKGTPYICNRAIMNYVLLLEMIFDNNEFKEMIFKSCIAWVVYNELDTRKVQNVSFNKFLKMKNQIGFYNEIIKALVKKNVTYNNISLPLMLEIIDKKLEILYKNLGECS